MANLEKTLFDKIFRPNRFKRVIEVRSQIDRIEKIYDNLYMCINMLGCDSINNSECVLRYYSIKIHIDEKFIYDNEGEIYLIFLLINYRDLLIEISQCGDIDIDDIILEVQNGKMENLK